MQITAHTDMTAPKERILECYVTFLTKEDGGRSHPLGQGALSNYRYRPHFVVGDTKQREVILANNVIQEEYLGVAFFGGPDLVEPNKPLKVLVSLIYPDVDYSQLSAGAMFTIREGGHIVGYGEVIQDKRSEAHLF